MQWIFYILGCIFALPGLLIAAENWRIWYWNRFKRGSEAPLGYYPVIGGFLLFLAARQCLPEEHGLWAFLALLLDFGCLPLACISCRRLFAKRIAR